MPKKQHNIDHLSRDAADWDHRRAREALQRQLKDLSKEAGALRRRVRRMTAFLFARGLLVCFPVALCVLSSWVTAINTPTVEGVR
jgi:hypothetical protein